MEAIKSNFLKELSDLRCLISFYDLEGKLLSDFQVTVETEEIKYLKQLSESLRKFPLSKKQFNYNSIIISLYGSFERFIENSLVTYSDKINQIVRKYNNLPDSILKNHFFLSLTLLNKVEQDNYAGHLSKEELIKNLHTCINVNEGYQLNKDAFAQHTANFRHQVIEECFSHLGIQNISQRILKTSIFLYYIIEKLEIHSPDAPNVDESFQQLNELAERRNDVAHGVPSEIIQNNILIDFVEFFEKFSAGLIEVLSNELLHREVDEFGTQLGELRDVYSDGEVICIHTNKIPIKIGDEIIGKNKNQIVKSKILEMKLNDINVEFTDDKSDFEIGLKIR